MRDGRWNWWGLADVEEPLSEDKESMPVVLESVERRQDQDCTTGDNTASK